MSYERKTRVLLVDDHRVVRRGFKLILATAPDLEVVAEASDGREALELAKTLQPNVVVIDVSMPGWNGIESTIRILEACPNTRVLALSMHREAIYVREMLRAGAHGYLVKDADDDAFVEAVRAVARGEGYLSPAVSKAVRVADPSTRGIQQICLQGVSRTCCNSSRKETPTKQSLIHSD